MNPVAAGFARVSFHPSLGLARWWLLCLVLACGAVHAQTLVPNTVAVGSVNQTVTVGSVLPQRFVIRITNAQGQPLAGVRVGYNINVCLEGVPPPGGGCPPAALYGRFDTTDGRSEAISDASGLATSAPFMAGSIPGQYEVFSYLPPQQVGTLQIPFNTQFTLFAVNQVLGSGVPSASAIPTTGTWGLIGMALLLLCAAMIRLKATRPQLGRAIGDTHDLKWISLGNPEHP